MANLMSLSPLEQKVCIALAKLRSDQQKSLQENPMKARSTTYTHMGLIVNDPPVSATTFDKMNTGHSEAAGSNEHKTGIINDPLGQTHSLVSREHFFSLCFVMLDFEKWRRTNIRTCGHVRKQ